MKRALFATLCIFTLAGAAVAGTIRVENSDSKTHKVELNCSGSKKSIEIRGSTTASYTFHSSSKECEIIGGTIKFPTKKMIDGQKWKIKDDKAKAN